MSSGLSYTSLFPRHRARLSSNNMTINLSDVESQLCTLLDEFTQQLRTENQVIECCIAGGWVRDKLLGLSSNDIDIALSSMMGFPFAVQFSQFLESRSIPVTRVTKVESRAEQSKHLETAKVAVLGLDLDFVNLRSEVYAEGSRIPVKVEFGTKLEDTLRRDTTINALLYNIHTRSVEDHTGKGLSDLRDGIIRTPLPPKQTFLDDPLRVLRCVRFASRFGYELVPELADAARDGEIQANTKITRERVGEEMHKMMKGPDPLRAIELIDSLSLSRSIFTPPPPTVVPTDISYHTAPIAARILSQLLSTVPTNTPLHSSHPSILSYILSSTSAQSRLYLACALTPFKGLTYTDKKKKKLLVEACIREGLKLGVQNHFLDGIPPLFEAAAMLHQPMLEKYRQPSQRVALGLMLRDKRIHCAITGTHWTGSILFALVQELVPLWKADEGGLDVLAANEVIDTYNALAAKLEELDLPKVVESPPLLNGTQVTTLLSKKPGQWLSGVLNKVVEWQLDNPQGTQEACKEWLKQAVDEGMIDVGVDPERPKAKKAKLSKE
ncbi:hypothetical protein BU17DRAFT_84117 [Hysterangium stoloniferum]|nr:hypothetical protein BU17DRAFT_84117 [Hysterangium stoloniferum]